MSSKAEYSFTWNEPVIASLKNNIMARMLSMGYKINNTAKANAPYLTGALVNSIRVDTSEEDVVYVIAGGKVGGKSIPYAKRQEYENKRHPYYMRNAFRDVTRNYKQFFKDLA